jgi:hypothetical protein
VVNAVASLVQNRAQPRLTRLHQYHRHRVAHRTLWRLTHECFRYQIVSKDSLLAPYLPPSLLGQCLRGKAQTGSAAEEAEAKKCGTVVEVW